MPVVVLVSVTVAPGTTEPLASRTVPTTEPVSNWAWARAGKQLKSTPARHTRCRRESRICHLKGFSGMPSIVAANCNASASEAQIRPQIAAGQIVAFYLFDVAETIDLAAI